MSDTVGLIIGGHTVSGEGPEIDVVDPSDGSIIGGVGTASEEQVDRAVTAGVKGLSSSGWADSLPHERARVLSRIAAKIEGKADHLANLQMRENGKTFHESLVQARSAADYFRYYAAVCEVMEDVVPPSRGNYLTMSRHEPYGVVAALTPWNSPLTMGAQKIAPALAAGNAVVLKASETTSLVSLALGECCVDAGLSEGLISVIAGKADIGRALVNHKDISLVSFTGGTSTGQFIAQDVASRLVPLILELGGKSPHIVFADADIDAAARAVASGIFGGAGQSCVAGSRLFVEESVRELFIERLVQIAGDMIVGPPMQDDTVIGPLSSFAHRERVEGLVASAVAEGGQIIFGGKRPEGDIFDKGAYYLPTIIDGLNNKSRLAQEEVFGPVLCVIPFGSEEELVSEANDSVFGLAAGIWTSKYPRAWRIAKALHAGTVWINCYKQLSITASFGGYKLSGLGREKGIQGMRAYQQVKSIYWGM
ncbi:MAG: aldehyde dehydrogenase family protein [Methyloligellaceae bacterium]